MSANIRRGGPSRVPSAFGEVCQRRKSQVLSSRVILVRRNNEKSQSKPIKTGVMIKKILIGIAAVIAIFVIVVASRPAEFRVERSATLGASPAALFDFVNNHRK